MEEIMKSITPILKEGNLSFVLIDQCYREACAGAREPYTIAVYYEGIKRLLNMMDFSYYGTSKEIFGYGNVEEFKEAVLNKKTPIKFHESLIIPHNENNKEIRFHSFAQDRELIILTILD